MDISTTAAAVGTLETFFVDEPNSLIRFVIHHTLSEVSVSLSEHDWRFLFGLCVDC